MCAQKQRRGREREFQAGSALSALSLKRGSTPQTMRSWPELRWRVGRLTNRATQVPFSLDTHCWWIIWSLCYCDTWYIFTWSVSLFLALIASKSLWSFPIRAMGESFIVIFGLQAPGWVSRLSGRLLISAQVRIPGFWDPPLNWALCWAWSLL